jgi:hypothetical protein
MGKEILPDPDMQPHGPRGMKRVLTGANEDPPEERIARFLGIFSLALGTAELLAPRGVARLIGMPGAAGLLRIFGIREIASGIGILSGQRPVKSLWSRVFGDALDIATLLGIFVASPRRTRTATALLAVAGVTLLDIMCARQLADEPSLVGRRPTPTRADRLRLAGSMSTADHNAAQDNNESQRATGSSNQQQAGTSRH